MPKIMLFILLGVVAWYSFFSEDEDFEAELVRKYWSAIPSLIRRFFQILSEDFWRLLLFFVALVVVVWGSSEQMWGVWILVVAPAGILLSENSAEVKVGLQTFGRDVGKAVGTAIMNIMQVVGLIAAVVLLLWIVVEALMAFERWDNQISPNFQDNYSEHWEPYDPSYGEDRCIGDCNDMDGDGRTWNDEDRDGDGLYESNP